MFGLQRFFSEIGSITFQTSVKKVLVYFEINHTHRSLKKMNLFYPPEIKCSKDVIIKDSKIHGKGLFASKKINEGTVVAFYDGICVKFED